MEGGGGAGPTSVGAPVAEHVTVTEVVVEDGHRAVIVAVQATRRRPDRTVLAWNVVGCQCR